MRVAFITLGCKVNQVETQNWKEIFVTRGYEIVDFSQMADIYVINTCSVTSIADKKSRAAIRRAKKQNPEGKVVVTGCYGEIFSQQVAGMPGVDLIVPNLSKEQLFEYVEELMAGRKNHRIPPEPSVLQSVCYTCRQDRTRGFIKIEDGCESFCSYCIIPYARGPVRSKAPPMVLKEIKSMLALGYKELVLTGIHVGQYGKDLKEWSITRLVDLILNEVEGNYRFRLGSIEPNDIEERLIELLASQPRICRHLHIPLQSGSDAILKLMNRNYTGHQYARLLADINQEVPGIGLTADVMVGFPGEGETEFSDTWQLIADSPINDLHVFRYSERPKTPAIGLPGKVSEAKKNERSKALINLGRQKKAQFHDKMAGQKLVVLTEERTSSGVRSLSDNYLNVLIEDNNTELNQFFLVETGLNEGDSILARLDGVFCY